MKLKLETGHDNNIIIAGHNQQLLDDLGKNFKLEQFNVFYASETAEIIDKINRYLPVLVLLVASSGISDIIKRLKASSDVMIMVISDTASFQERMECLKIGADEYLAGPINFEEIIVKAQVLLRHSERLAKTINNRIRIDQDLELDITSHSVIVRGKEIYLRPIEFLLLYHLINNAGRLVSNEELIQKVWGREYVGSNFHIWSHIAFLRKKIEKDPQNPKYIINRRGVGYYIAINK